MNGLALSVNEGVKFVKSLRGGEPLKSGRRNGGGENQQYRGMIREGNDEVAAFDWVNGVGESEWKRSKSLWVENLVNGERAGVEGKRSCVGGREGENGGSVDYGGGEIEVEGEGDVGSEWVS